MSSLPASSILSRLLRRLDWSPAAEVTFDETAFWPAGLLDQLLASGLLSPAEPAPALVCDECGELHEVLLADSRQTPPVAALLRCSVAGAQPVSPERLRRWQVTTPRLIEQLVPLLELSGSSEELVKGRLWRLGSIRIAGLAHSIHFGRSLAHGDGLSMVRQAKLPARSVIFVPGIRPACELGLGEQAAMVALDAVLTIEGGQLHFDREAAFQQLPRGTAIDLPRPRAARPRPKRGSRMALVESLRRELEEHLRAARDYALATEERTGTPELLPRPTMEFLARRLRVNKSTVSRCFADRAGGELRMLWAVAADIDRLLMAGRHRS